jgi:type VII secretion system (Wss) protein YukD
MLIPTILVTIRGPLKTIDLELPGDVSVGELIPLLLEMCGSQENDSQELLQAPISLQAVGTRAPLSSDRTLIDAGVYDGAVLMLQAKHSPSPQAKRLVPPQFVPKSVQPGTKTGGIGVTWKTLG